MTSLRSALDLVQEPFGRLDLTGHEVVVSGAASGIGRAAAMLVASRGGFVTAVDIDDRGLTDLVAAASELHLRVDSEVIDVSDQESVERLMSRYAGERQLRALINCVGITGSTGIVGHKVELEDFNRVLELNLSAAFVLSRAAIIRMLPHHYGRILHLASIAGKEGNPGMVSYSASKAGLIGMVKSLAKDYAEDGITINALAPAVILTPLVEAMPTEQVELNVRKIPMGRLGSLDEVAEAIGWAVSPAASFTTGFTFDLSGGRATY